MVLKSCRLADFYRKGGFVPRQVIGRDRRIPGHAIVQPGTVCEVPVVVRVRGRWRGQWQYET